MRLFFKTVYYRLPVIALCGFIYWQSSYPGIISEPLFPHDDKIIHILVYGLLGFLSARCLSIEALTPQKIKIIAIIFATLFGLSDEIHQSFTPERCASGYDLLADFTGAVIGSLSYSLKTQINLKRITGKK